jgi:hypothetical protein
MEQLEKSSMKKAFEVDPEGTTREVPSAADKKKAEEERTSRVARSASKYLKETKGATEFNNMQKALRQLEKWQPPKIATARESRGRRQAKGTAYGGAAHSGFEQGMQKRTLYKAFGIQVQDRSQPSPLFLQKNIDLQKNMDEYLDVYDEILQKADMDWNNVTDEDFARLEKIDLGRFFGRGKKEDKPKKVSGDRVAAAEKVQTGIREAQAKQEGKRTEEARRAGLSSRERFGEDIGPGGALAKPVKEGRAEKIAGALGRFGSNVKGKADQRQNIGRKIGETKDSAIAGGKKLATQTRDKTVATATEARKRGSAAADVLATGRTRNIKPTFSDTKMGRDQARLQPPTVPNRVKQRHASLGQNVPSLNAIPESGEAPGKQVTRGSAYKAPKSADPAAAKRRAMAGGLSMSKAMISLQKISNGDTPKQNKNVASPPKTPEERKAWQKDYYQNIKHKGRGDNLTGTQRYD